MDLSDEDDAEENEEVPLETQVEELEQYWPYTKNLVNLIFFLNTNYTGVVYLLF